MAIFVYSTILFFSELRDSFSKWLGSIQILNTVEWNPTGQKVQFASCRKDKRKEYRRRS